MQETEDSAYVIARLREIGVGLSLDDFGTGFSSLSRISHLPVTELKVDRSFVLNIDREVSSIIVTEAAINIGKRLGLSVVVEGVEDKSQECAFAKSDVMSCRGIYLRDPCRLVILKRGRGRA
jgi:EAL domain-containing protein (putative c-di-GMP-specific phosphodiesterase class I)